MTIKDDDATTLVARLNGLEISHLGDSPWSGILSGQIIVQEFYIRAADGIIKFFLQIPVQSSSSEYYDFFTLGTNLADGTTSKVEIVQGGTPVRADVRNIERRDADGGIAHYWLAVHLHTDSLADARLGVSLFAEERNFRAPDESPFAVAEAPD